MRAIPLAAPSAATRERARPYTHEEAMMRVLLELSASDRALLRQASETDLSLDNPCMGEIIRNICGLWRGRENLLPHCGPLHLDSGALAVVKEIWQVLKLM